MLETHSSVPAVTELPDSPAIADYLNATLALMPPLQVSGLPPLLHIYLQPTHVGSIGGLLPRLEAALRSLSAEQCWDVYLFVEERSTEAVPNGPTARLIHHSLIEPRRSSTAPALQLPTFTAEAPDPVAEAVPESQPIEESQSTEESQPTESTDSTPLLQLPSLTTSEPSPSTLPRSVTNRPVTTTWQQQAINHRHRRQRRQAIFGILAITGVSFVLGSFTSAGVAWLLAGRESQPAAVEANIAELEPAIAPTDADTLAPGPDATGDVVNTPSASLPVSPNSLISPIAVPSELGAAANALTAPVATPAAVQLKAVGDVIPGTDFPNYRLPNDPNYLFNSVKMFMGEVDIVFGNFESTLTDHPYAEKDISQGMTFAFRTPPNWTDVLKSAGFDVLSVANNHSFDFGDAGFEDTIANIHQSGMQAVGRKGDIVKVEANGYTVASIGYSYWPDHNDMNDLATAAALVQQAQAEADMVVISVHAGAEGTDAMRVRNQTEYFFSENRGNMVHFSRSMIDAGADLILGHGPHVPRAVELYQGKLIAYSLGNFLGYRTLSTTGPLGLSMILQVDLDEAGNFLTGRVIPVALDKNGVPYIDNGFASVTLMRQLTRQDFPDTPLKIDEMGYILRTDQP